MPLITSEEIIQFFMKCNIRIIIRIEIQGKGAMVLHHTSNATHLMMGLFKQSSKRD